MLKLSIINEFNKHVESLGLFWKNFYAVVGWPRFHQNLQDFIAGISTKENLTLTPYEEYTLVRLLNTADTNHDFQFATSLKERMWGDKADEVFEALTLLIQRGFFGEALEIGLFSDENCNVIKRHPKPLVALDFICQFHHYIFLNPIILTQIAIRDTKHLIAIYSSLLRLVNAGIMNRDPKDSANMTYISQITDPNAVPYDVANKIIQSRIREVENTPAWKAEPKAPDFKLLTSFGNFSHSFAESEVEKEAAPKAAARASYGKKHN